MQQDMKGFTPEPNCGRGTMAIVWSCLATVVLCTYSTMHLDSNPSRGLVKVLVYNLGAIIAPEVMLIAAVQDFISAREVFMAASRNGVSLTFYQSHLVNMSGITIQQETPGNTQLLTSKEELLNALSIPRIRQAFPSDTEIMARSNGDSFSKLLTVMQLLWFTVQATSRHIQGQVISLLEVATLAFISMSLITNLFWLKKPRNLSSPIIIHDNTSFQRRWKIRKTKNSHVIESVSAAVSFATFGAIHLLAWNYAFPSVAEKWLWRICSLLIITVPCIFITMIQLPDSVVDRNPGSPAFTINVFIFVLARLYLLVEAFLVFRSVPSSVYEPVDWSAYFIHF
jgi:hypothetical protein